MINFGLSIGTFLGIVLMLLGIFLPILGLVSLLRTAPQRDIQVLTLAIDIILGLVYIICGLILIYNGWRLDPILAFVQFLLTVSTIYWIGKDLRDRF